MSSTFVGELEREVVGKVEEGGSISCEKDPMSGTFADPKMYGNFVGELEREWEEGGSIRHLRGRTGKRSGGRRELEREVVGKVEAFHVRRILCLAPSQILRCMATLWENWKESGKKVEAFSCEKDPMSSTFVDPRCTATLRENWKESGGRKVEAFPQNVAGFKPMHRQYNLEQFRDMLVHSSVSIFFRYGYRNTF